MSVRWNRTLLLGGVVALATSLPALAQSPNSQGNDGSSGDQYGNQSTTRQDEDRQSNSNDRSNRGQDQSSEYRSDQSDQRNQDRFGRDDRQQRRDARQSDRQSERQSSSGDQGQRPAIGVTVIERGGMGVRVTRVLPQSPAAQAGLEPGDTILEVDGRRVATPQQLISAIESNQVGDTAELAVLSDGRERAVNVRLSSRQEALPPQLRNQQFREGRFGVDGSQRQFAGDGQRDWGRDGQRWDQNQGRDQGNWEQNRNWDQGNQQQFRQNNYGQYESGQGSDGPPSPPAESYGRSAHQGQTNYQGQYGSQQRGQYDSQQRGRYGNQQGYDRGVVTTDYQDGQRSADDRQWQPGDRIAQRLDQLESRIERLTERLEALQRDGASSSNRTSDTQNADATSGSQDSDNRQQQ